jgi:O-antigen ligase/polysaccharide polymerase Wzy-like membrane protein
MTSDILPAPAGYRLESGLTALERGFLIALCLILAGYALLGRGFAYIGVAPLFLGELTLMVGMAAWFTRSRPFVAVQSVPGAALMAFMLLGAARLAADLPTYGVAAIRDAVLWGYGLFALSVASVLSREPEALRVLVRRFRPFAATVIGAAGVLFILSEVFGASMPTIPGTNARIPGLKGGDTMVHLAGAVAFVLVGLARKSWWMLPVLIADFGLIAMRNRGGMLAFLMAMMVVLVFRSRRVRVGKWSYLALVGIVVLIVVNPRINLYGERSVSLDQLVDNFRSLTGNSGSNALDGSKEWRLSWWSDIIEYTFAGPYFLAGKGFGVNLASEDGYQVDEEESLRSPHNGHFSVLARMGVPAFALWILLQLSWASAMVRNLLKARKREEDGWHGLFLFLLAYWVAFMVNITFDVFIEGPMGGIWFWTLFGVGLGSLNIYNRQWR